VRMRIPWLVAALLTLLADPSQADPSHADPSLAGPRRPQELAAKLQAALDDWRSRCGFAGATLGLVLPDESRVALSTGLADREAKTPMEPTHRMLAGSVGKTFHAALALALVREGKLSLDEKVGTYLGEREWFARLPNAGAITVRMLMNHSSGLVRYELDPKFLEELTKAPRRRWKPEEQLAFVLDRPAPFPAGERFEYSDTNYVVLGLVIEAIAGEPCPVSIARRFLAPLELEGVVPSDRVVIPRLAQGYAGAGNPFGGFERMLADGELAIDPQFEGAGGGYATTAIDLARWARALWGGDALLGDLRGEVEAGVPAPMLGRDARYGLGVILRDTPLGPSLGHDGFFPGYMAQVRWFPGARLAVALQVNTSVPSEVPGGLGRALIELATLAR
jgi:D-alanyl-D-alanine carboxypeptidase